MQGSSDFRKYGQKFEPNEGLPEQDIIEPESPYEALPNISPKKRAVSQLELEQAELNELRGAKDFHYD